jgi:hypothetical protein
VLWYGAFLAISQWTALDVEYEVMEMDGSFDHPEILDLRKVSPLFPGLLQLAVQMYDLFMSAVSVPEYLSFL